MSGDRPGSTEGPERGDHEGFEGSGESSRAPDRRLPPESATPLFERAGFRDPRSGASHWHALWAELPDGHPFVETWSETWELLGAAADPALALSRLLRWVEAEIEDAAGSGGEGEQGGAETRAARWVRSRRFRTGFVAVAGVSPALGESLLSAWPGFDPDAWENGWESRESLSTRLRSELESVAASAFLGFLRRFQRIELLRIAYLDCVEDYPVRQITRQISILADTLIDALLERARVDVARRMGLVAPDRGFAVLALGKLGGEELNYSSDVDVNFVRDEGLESIPRVSGQPVTDPFDIETYFTRVAERLIAYVTRFEGDGPLYRLDARLRPQGSSGRLVWSASASIEYYYGVGRTWERQALIRMRHLAGDAALSGRLVAELRGFVFPAALSAEEISSMRALKHQVERIASGRGDQDREIKIGEGGIRDVEYIVQYLQLVYGASHPALRAANLFEALEVLEQEGLLAASEADVLRRGYRFLRRVEHRIQMSDMLQTHRLPEDGPDLLRLARGLGFASTEQFRGRLALHTIDIRRVYRLLFEQATERQPVEDVLPSLLDLPRESAEPEAARWLAPYGFQEPEKAFARLQSLARPGRTLSDAGHDTRTFRSLLFKLLRELSAQAQPDRALANLEDCVATLGARHVFYQLLESSDETLAIFVEICARSTLLVEIIRANPQLFDEVVDALVTGYTFGRERLLEELEARREAGSDFARDLFAFKYLHLVVAAIRDLQGQLKLRSAMQTVADICEAVFVGVLSESEARAREKLGRWTGEPPRYVVLGLGKLGGREMTYRSDVDVVFLHDGEGLTDRGVAPVEYFERLSQFVLAGCKSADSRGPLLDVDVRLRPLGSHNNLSISVAGWKQYFRDGPARTWERQAFLRARPIAGDEELGEEACRYIRDELVLGGSAGPPDARTIRDDIWEMRQRLERHAGPENLKRGRGGIMDVEFTVQALQLIHGREHPEVVVPNTGLAIERLQAAGVLPQSSADGLFASYRFLRWVENRASLVTEPGESIVRLDEARLRATIQKMGYRSSGEESASEIFRAEVRHHRDVIRGAFLRALERDEDGSEGSAARG